MTDTVPVDVEAAESEWQYASGFFATWMAAAEMQKWGRKWLPALIAALRSAETACGDWIKNKSSLADAIRNIRQAAESHADNSEKLEALLLAERTRAEAAEGEKAKLMEIVEAQILLHWSEGGDMKPSGIFAALRANPNLAPPSAPAKETKEKANG